MKLFSFSLYIVSLLLLLVYSYTQVDLNLTLSSAPAYQAIQHQLTLLGYFQRPLSAYIFVALLSLMFVAYGLLLWLAREGLIRVSELIKLGVITVMVLIFSYPAFSYDIFNYIFDARILIHHHADPFTHTALDFPDDLWTRFMRWTHRTYPYGPAWLPLTLPFYMLGLGKFVVTLMSFKVLGALSYLVAIYSLVKILTKTKVNNVPFALALFSLNPLIIIESLVSVHLDISMAALMLFSLYLIINGNRVWGVMTLLTSIGIKYASISLVPFLYLHQKRKIGFESLIRYSLVGSYAVTLVAIYMREILPWYFIVPFALTALVPKSRLAVCLMLGLTVGSLLRYAPFLYYGDYTATVDFYRHFVFVVGSFIVFVATYLYLRSNTSIKS